MRHARALLPPPSWAIIVSCCTVVSAILRQDNSMFLPTSTFIRFGPQDPTVELSTIFISTPRDLCSAKNRKLIEGQMNGKIVVCENCYAGMLCSPTNIYPHVESAGALAFVHINTLDTKGINTFAFTQFPASKYASSKMPIIEAFDYTNTFSAALKTENGTAPMLGISRPHSKKFEALNKQPSGIFIAMILPALICTATAVSAATQVHELWSTKRFGQNSVRLFLCAVELPTNLIFGLLMACGHIGYRQLPLYIDRSFNTGLCGTLCACSALLTAYLHHQVTRTIQNTADRRHDTVWKRYGKFLAVYFLVAVLYDCSEVMYYFSNQSVSVTIFRLCAQGCGILTAFLFSAFQCFNVGFLFVSLLAESLMPTTFRLIDSGNSYCCFAHHVYLLTLKKVHPI